jgi:bifunctional DNA-binding transcriptional regulator/antitoxin component of YhaV-PrlF toxin-antitoxin module
MNTEFAVQLTTEGMIPVPEPLQRELGLRPQQIVYLRRDEASGNLIIEIATPQAVGDRIVALMAEAFQDVTWTDLQVERADDVNRG